ncbi:MAG: TIGR01777 family oxidoreductase [Candidatus Eisenbacteria bacterium]|nr:TIGR01777 family oxidoreductase [Candidatus Eisenbacteria bacterium]
MPEFRSKSRLMAPVESVFAWHERPGAFERLVPPWVDVRILSRSGGVKDGGQLSFKLRQGPISVRWHAVHEGYQENRQFRDVQRKGPFASWEHTHRFEPDGETASYLEDLVYWQLPLGRLGRFGESLVAREIERGFTFRQERTRQDLARHRGVVDRGPLRILMSGASGLIGTQLAAFLEGGGHTIARLVRRAPRSPLEIRWDPDSGALDPAACEGFDAVIHLAGAGIADERWSPKRKQLILESRTRGTRLLAERLSLCARKPRCLLVASGIGYYGHRPEEPLTESSEPGTGYLPEVCLAWEDASKPAEAAGIRVARIRIGIVLAAAGGALSKLAPIFSAGLGGPVGSGQQVLSWIAFDDLIGIFHHALFHDELSGAINATAPNPVTNEDFSGTLAEVLGRASWARVPEQAIDFGFGEMGRRLLLEGARVLPAKLEQSGFPFLWPDLEGALRFELGRPEEE